MSKANVNNNNNNEYIYIPELEEGMTATAVVDRIVNKNIESKKKKKRMQKHRVSTGSCSGEGRTINDNIYIYI